MTQYSYYDDASCSGNPVNGNKVVLYETDGCKTVTCAANEETTTPETIASQATTTMNPTFFLFPISYFLFPYIIIFIF